MRGKPKGRSNGWGISEGKIEDSVCNYPNVWLGDYVEIIGRQIQLPHGVLDVLAYGDLQAYVIELKARKIRGADISQVLKYCYDVSEYLQTHYVNDVPGPDNYDPDPRGNRGTPPFFANYSNWTTAYLSSLLAQQFDWGIFYDMAAYDYRCDVIKPVLVGTDIDESILAAASAAKIEIIIWNLNSETGRIEVEHKSGWQTIGPEPYWERSGCEWLRKLTTRIIRASVEYIESTKPSESVVFKN